MWHRLLEEMASFQEALSDRVCRFQPPKDTPGRSSHFLSVWHQPMPQLWRLPRTNKQTLTELHSIYNTVGRSIASISDLGGIHWL